VKGEDGKLLLKAWLRWAARSRIPAFVTVARKIRYHLDEIHNTLGSGLSNARSEATNTHLQVLTRRAYGYKNAEALIAIADLTRGGLCPPLPGR
jgi:transposase